MVGERVREGKIEAPLDVVFTGFGFKHSSCQAFSVSQTLQQIIPRVLQKKPRPNSKYLPFKSEWIAHPNRTIHTNSHPYTIVCFSFYIWRPTGTVYPKLSSANTKYILRKHTDTMKGNAVQCGFVPLTFILWTKSRYFLWPTWKKVRQFWNDVRVSKWCQIFIVGWTIPLINCPYP